MLINNFCPKCNNEITYDNKKDKGFICKKCNADLALTYGLLNKDEYHYGFSFVEKGVGVND